MFDSEWKCNDFIYQNIFTREKSAKTFSKTSQVPKIFLLAIAVLQEIIYARVIPAILELMLLDKKSKNKNNKRS